MSKDKNETKKVKTTARKKQVKSKTTDSKSKKSKFKDKHPKAAKAIKTPSVTVPLEIPTAPKQ